MSSESFALKERLIARVASEFDAIFHRQVLLDQLVCEKKSHSSYTRDFLRASNFMQISPRPSVNSMRRGEEGERDKP